jgi:hypothetical protein
LAAIPEFAPELEAHLAFNHQMLPHVLFGDLTRWVIDLYRQSQGHSEDRPGEVLARTLRFLEDRFSDPLDAAAHDLIAVSFLENLHQAGSDYRGLKEQMGPNLRSWLTRLD